jgi:hypothetical protein
MARLLDELLPDFDVNEEHETRVAAPPDVAWAAVQAVTPGEIRLLGPLMAIRGLPARLRGGSAPDQRDPQLPILDAMQRQGFTLIGERPGEEGVLGIVGRFWSLEAMKTIRPIAGPEDFVAFAEPGYAKAAMDLRVVPDGAGSRVLTETRIAGTDAEATKKFRRYWFVVGGGSALIRRSWLGAIRARAEAPARGSASAG